MISNNEFDDWGQKPNGTPQHDADGNSSVDLMQVAMRRKGLIALGVFLGIGLGVLYYARATEMYESSAQLLISEESSPFMARDEMTLGVGFSKADDHAIGLSSPRIITDALANNKDLTELQSLVNEENQVKTILDNLTVTPFQEGSDVLQLVYKGTNAEDCGQILDAIMQTYTDFLNKKRTDMGKVVVEQMTEARDDLQVNLEKLNKEYEEWKNNESRLFQQAEQGIILEQVQLGKIEDDIFTIQREIGNLTNEIGILKEAIDEGYDPDSLLMMAQTDGRTPGLPLQEDDMELRMRRMEEQRQIREEEAMFKDEEAALRYGEDHPQRRILQRKIDLAKKIFEDRINAMGGVDEDENLEANSSAKILANYMQSLQVRIRRNTKDLQTLLEQRKIVKEAAKSQLQDVARQRWFEDQIAQQESLFNAAIEKLSEINLSEQYGSEEKFRIERFSDPGIGIKTDPSLAKSLAGGTMLGFLAGFGLGYLVEMFDKTFRSPQEVSDMLQLPMIGHIPEIIPEPVENTVMSDTLIAAHKPKSPLAENFRAIRTALYFSTAGQQNRVIQTTSPVPGDGKSTLTANLAITIAQSNKSVLLVDADFRRPSQHKLFGVSNATGLASVVVGQADPREAAQATEVPNLHLMACGPRPHNPSELLTSPQFAELLEVLREQYDFVLIDTPPVLAVTDPGIVSARVDGVIMALRIRKNGRPGALRARKILRDLDANMLGIVVNGIDHRSGAYGYYSNYRRGYGNYGGYGQSQESAEQLIGKYFEEPPVEELEAEART